jgi:predicted enzyme related to lactoylglutathione lyase
VHSTSWSENYIDNYRSKLLGCAAVTVLRPHLAITVTDVHRSVPFYEALFGVPAAKLRDGYAKFELEEPALNFTLNAGERVGGLGALNHAGIQVGSTDDVLAAQLRLRQAGLATFEELDTACCYARQDKVWVTDPDGTPWEVFVTHEDVEDQARATTAPACC